MKGSLTAVISTSLCSTLWRQVSYVFTARRVENLRIAEDDPTNATEAIDSDLKGLFSCLNSLCRAMRAYLDSHGEEVS